MSSSEEEGAKKRKRGSLLSVETARREKILLGGKALAKKEFEAKRAEVLRSIPVDYRNRMGQICFTRWQKLGFLPILILNPYDVPPGAVREKWLAMYEKVSRRRRIDAGAVVSVMRPLLRVARYQFLISIFIHSLYGGFLCFPVDDEMKS